MAITYLNEIITSTFQIIALGSFFMLASRFILQSMPYSFADFTVQLFSGQLFNNVFDTQPSGYQKRIAPEKVSLSRQKVSKQKISRALGL